MHRKIIIAAFEKAYEDVLKESGVVPSLKKQGEHLSSKLHEINGSTFGFRSLTDLHKLADKEGAEVEIKQPQVVHALCKYLGYEDYVDYIARHPSKGDRSKTVDGGVLILAPEGSKAQTLQKPETTTTKTRTFNKSLIIKISIAVTILTSIVVGIVIFNEQKWMEWKGDHYEKETFDKEGVQDGTLKLYKEDRIENFKKVTVTCYTQFFNVSGDVKIWYGKNKAGDLEYFTDTGLHPTTGKTLKPITKYMIDKYICRPLFNTSVVNTPAREVAVLGFVGIELEESVSTVIGAKLFKKGVQPVNLFFTERLSDELKYELKHGDFSSLPNLNKFVDEVWIVSATYSFKESTIDSTLVVCIIELYGFVFNTGNGQSKLNNELLQTLKGTGYSVKEAIDNTFNKLIL